jgi:hypothetical protein
MSAASGVTAFAMLAIFALALAMVLATYRTGGLEWDFIAEVLYAKSLLSPSFYSALIGGNLSNAVLYGNSFYFEALRPPLIGLMMAPFLLLGTGAGVPLYMAFLLIFLLASLLCLSKAIRVGPLLLELLFFTPFTALFFLLLNGAEIATLCFLALFIALVLQKRWESGILLGLAGLAKYDSLIFVLLLLVLPRGARRKAFAAFVLTTLPWLAFNAVAFHSPIASYVLSIGSFSHDAQGFFSLSVIAGSLELMLPDLLPAFLALFLAFVASRVWAARRPGRAARGADGYRYRVVMAVFLVGLLGWLVVAVSGSMNDLPRESYLIYLGIALALGVGITDLSSSARKPPFGGRLLAVCTCALFLATAWMLVYSYLSLPNYVFGPYGSSNSIYGDVTAALASQGLGNCSVVSNNWVYLIYDGVKAHFPYYYNSSVERYPIVFFTGAGSIDSPVNLDNVTRKVNFTGFYIAFPRNYTCAR